MIKLDTDNINLFDFISQDIENNLDYYYDEYCKIFKENDSYSRLKYISLRLEFNFKFGKKDKSGIIKSCYINDKTIMLRKYKTKSEIELFLNNILKQRFKTKDRFHNYIIKKIFKSKQEILQSNSSLDLFIFNLEDIYNLKGDWNMFEFLNQSQIIELIKKIELDIQNTDSLLEKENILVKFLQKFNYGKILDSEERQDILPPIFLAISNLINTYIKQTNSIPKNEYKEYIRMIIRNDDKKIDRFVFLKHILATKNARLICETLDVFFNEKVELLKIKDMLKSLEFHKYYLNITDLSYYHYKLDQCNLHYYDENKNTLTTNRLLRIDDIGDYQVYNNNYIWSKIKLYNTLLKFNNDLLNEENISEIKEYIGKLEKQNKDNFIEIK